MVDILLKAGANVRGDNTFVLREAAKEGHGAVVTMLRKARAKANE